MNCTHAGLRYVARTDRLIELRIACTGSTEHSKFNERFIDERYAMVLNGTQWSAAGQSNIQCISEDLGASVAGSNASEDTNSITSLSEFRRLIFQCGIQSLMHAECSDVGC